jgi:hypothetical protein
MNAVLKQQFAAQTLEQMLADDIASFQHDPAGFIWYAFPWGVKGGPLEKAQPRKWTLEVCESIKQKFAANAVKPGSEWDVISEAIASGHGIGKTAFVAQITLWAMSTFPQTRGVATANTDTQLRTKLWPEIYKWHAMCITKHWFTVTATAIFHKRDEKNWRIDAVPWSVSNLEAFQGLHNYGKRVVLLMEEASGIDDPVYETAEGAMTDEGTEIIWIAIGNPTRAQGRFRQCFTRFRELWTCRNIDSRTVEGTNKKRIERWAKIYGEASQFFKIRVMGLFADADPNQLIAMEWLAEARARGEKWNHAIGDGSKPKVRVSVDVADGGEDDTVVTGAIHWYSCVVARKQTVHRFAPGLAPILAADAAEAMFLELGGVKESQDDFVVDGLGVGAGTVGTLMLRGYNVVRYCGGEQSANPKRWRNRRVQSYMGGRDALRNGTLHLHPEMCEDQEAWDELDAQLTSIKSKPGTEKVEDLITKEEQRRDRAAEDSWQSPDRADSLIMQFATQTPTVHASGDAKGFTTVAVRSNLMEGME